MAGDALAVSAATLDGMCSTLRSALGDLVETSVHSVFEVDTDVGDEGCFNTLAHERGKWQQCMGSV